jgi:hypothetical protein
MIELINSLSFRKFASRVLSQKANLSFVVFSFVSLVRLRLKEKNIVQLVRTEVCVY